VIKNLIILRERRKEKEVMQKDTAKEISLKKDKKYSETKHFHPKYGNPLLESYKESGTSAKVGVRKPFKRKIASVS